MQLISFQDDEYIQVAKSLNEATNLIENGFEYVTEMGGCKLFRKKEIRQFGVVDYPCGVVV